MKTQRHVRPNMISMRLRRLYLRLSYRMGSVRVLCPGMGVPG